jgi:hypothetical protein
MAGRRFRNNSLPVKPFYFACVDQQNESAREKIHTNIETETERGRKRERETEKKTNGKVNLGFMLILKDYFRHGINSGSMPMCICNVNIYSSLRQRLDKTFLAYVHTCMYNRTRIHFGLQFICYMSPHSTIEIK